MTPEHERELIVRARTNSALKVLLDMRAHEASLGEPIDDETFYHLALTTMTDIANTMQRTAIEYANRATALHKIYVDAHGPR